MKIRDKREHKNSQLDIDKEQRNYFTEKRKVTVRLIHT
jgi:hypothetical protein